MNGKLRDTLSRLVELEETMFLLYNQAVEQAHNENERDIIERLVEQNFDRIRSVGETVSPKQIVADSMEFIPPPGVPLIKSICDGVYYVDAELRIQFWNHGAQRMTGFTEREVKGKTCFDAGLNPMLDDGGSHCGPTCPIKMVLATGQRHTGVIHVRHKRGHTLVLEATATPIVVNETIIGAIQVFRDTKTLEALDRSRRQLKEMAYVDPLTGVQSRRGILEQLDIEMQKCRLFRDRSLTIGILDIDGFKGFNDTHGHPMGDQLLQTIAQNVQSLLRKEDFIGRLGGDEFLFILSNTNIEESIPLASRILEATGEVRFRGAPCNVTLSIGLAQWNRNDALNHFMGKADKAMYVSKKNGKNQISVSEAS